MNEEHYKKMTRIYIISYNEAMSITKNPDFSVQIATSVLSSAMMIENIQPKQQQANPLDILTAMMMKQAADSKEDQEDLEE